MPERLFRLFPAFIVDVMEIMMLQNHLSFFFFFFFKCKISLIGVTELDLEFEIISTSFYALTIHTTWSLSIIMKLEIKILTFFMLTRHI